MLYKVEYAYASHEGNVRANNEDNFWCGGNYLPAENQGTRGVQADTIQSAGAPVLAVFDGMGGECCGEMASFLAAEEMGRQCRDCGGCPDAGAFLQQTCSAMNQAVCAYGRENHIVSMGSTAALLMFGEKKVSVCNLGDSRVYRWTQGKMHRLSTDHVLGSGVFGKAPLTQYLGMDEEPVPSVSETEALEGDRYLICSDGLTDMLTEAEIAEILSRGCPVRETVGLLQDGALGRGGRDNITIVLGEIGIRPKGGPVYRWITGLWKKERRNEADEKPDAGSGF